MTEHVEKECDVLIIGSGAAGLTLALKLADAHPSIHLIVLSKGPITEGSTSKAQGGIAAVCNVYVDNDSIESHINDTLIAGAGLCEKSAVEFTVKNARDSIEWLISEGVDFDKDDDANSNDYHLTREGGHSHRRIFHAADATGKAVQDTLTNQALHHPQITVLEKYNVIDLVTTKKLGLPGNRVLGVYVLNCNTGKVESIYAKFTALCTGGASKVYQYTTNTEISSGDGIAMAWRAGCRVANMEFNQFHPTTLYNAIDRNFLLSEALRGEGALLKRPDGTRFMPDYDERGELAPRDVVARAIDHEMKRLGVDCMYLDISYKDPEFVKKHFPNIYERCLKVGIDITKEPIPVVPAAHYTCGGVMVDQRALTDISNLYAIGEVSYTGLHGANRMASNSILECLVYGAAAAKDILSKLDNAPNIVKFAPWDESMVTNSDEEVIIQHNWHELRMVMWDYVGIVRTNKRLERAKHRIDLLKKEVKEYYENFRVTYNLLELRNLLQIADLVVTSAMKRKESRGLNYNLDYPDLLKDSKPTVLTPENHA
ncbi:MAG: L-aspartate oxidase [Succinivibrionaceae bacterium]